jgi:hypothetical protein
MTRRGGGSCRASRRAGDNTARGGARTTQDERVADNRTKGRGQRTQHKSAVEAALLGCRFALRGEGHLGRRWVLRGGATGHGHYIMLWQIDCSLSLVVEQAAHGTQSHMKNPF